MKKKLIKPFAILLAVLDHWRWDGVFLIWWSAAKEESTKRKERNGLNCLISGKIIPGMVMQENIMRVRPGALNRRCRTVISKALTD